MKIRATASFRKVLLWLVLFGLSLSAKESKYSHLYYQLGYRNTAFTNSVGIEFIKIPAGSFQMGCVPQDKKCEDDEKPRHAVRIDREFYMGKYEVTQKQWLAVMGDNPSYHKNCDNCPVEKVSWDKIQVFLQKLNQKAKESGEKWQYRLPTEAEWEYANRAGSQTVYYWGDKMDGDYAWFSSNSKRQTHPVGQKKPNAFGLYDMSGNVWEWLQDCWDADYYKKAVYNNNSKNDKNLSNISELNSCKIRTLRGGSFSNVGVNRRSSNRYWFDANGRYWTYGFRLVSVVSLGGN